MSSRSIPVGAGLVAAIVSIAPAARAERDLPGEVAAEVGLSSVLMRAETVGRAVGPCPVRVGVPLVCHGIQLHWHPTAGEIALSRSLERGARESAKRRWLGIRNPMQYGIEAEPFVQLQMKRETLLVFSRITGESSFKQAAVTLPAGSTMRALMESEAAERTRLRATYIQIEDFKGPTPLISPQPVRIAFASVGGFLFGSGVLASRLLRSASPESPVSAQPQPWPPGIQISGHFDVP